MSFRRVSFVSGAQSISLTETQPKANAIYALLNIYSRHCPSAWVCVGVE